MLRTFSTFIILLATLICGCGHDRKPAPAAPAAAPPAAQHNEIPGVKAYRAGLAALATDDPDRAQSLLLDAIHQNKELAEAWFELGHLKVTLAPKLTQADELKAMVIFREGLQFEQEARKLIDQDKIFVWTPDQVDQARVKLESDLRDADRALADEDSLREALRQRVY